MNRYFLSFTSLLLLMVVDVASAQSVEKAVKYRQGAFTVMGWNFEVIVDMIKGKRPFDQVDFTRRAKIIANVSQIPMEGFATESHAGATKAKPEIWTNYPDFEQKMKLMQNAAELLATTSLSGDYDASKRAVSALGKTCKACHDEYRNK
ncbi:MAG: cytochrome c [Proteobacteria bacterium]|nr:cytochrome c [Pseudomonadota bacterium]